jgi:hypothetical protein
VILKDPIERFAAQFVGRLRGITILVSDSRVVAAWRKRKALRLCSRHMTEELLTPAALALAAQYRRAFPWMSARPALRGPAVAAQPRAVDQGGLF